MDLVRPAGKVPVVVHAQRNVGGPRQGQGLAVVQGLEHGQLLGVLLHQVRQLEENAAAFPPAHLAPRPALKGVPGGLDRQIDVFLVGRRHFRNDLLRPRVDRLEGLAAQRVRKL